MTSTTTSQTMFLEKHGLLANNGLLAKNIYHRGEDGAFDWSVNFRTVLKDTASSSEPYHPYPFGYFSVELTTHEAVVTQTISWLVPYGLHEGAWVEDAVAKVLTAAERNISHEAAENIKLAWSIEKTGTIIL